MSNHLTHSGLDLAGLLDVTAGPESGALVVFGGTVRDKNDGRSVDGITYTAYEPLAEETLSKIENEALASFPIQACRILHRLGELSVGDFSVLVVVRAAHRADAFAAARFAIDTLKQRVPIWKEEHYIDGESRHLEGTPLSASE